MSLVLVCVVSFPATNSKTKHDVSDTEAPVVDCPANQTISTNPGQAYATVVYSAPQVTDNTGATLTITCDTESGSHFEICETEVFCQAVDPTGNKATCPFTVKVQGMLFIIQRLRSITFIQNTDLVCVTFALWFRLKGAL